MRNCGYLCQVCETELHTKTQRHDQIRTIAGSKLNSMKDLISKALQDGQISDVEFKAILHDVERFNTMKEEICVKRSEITDDEKKRNK